MTDNTIAIIEGYTREVEANSDRYDFHLLVKSDTDFDSRFTAWDCDEQEWIMVNGWLFSFSDWR